MNSNKIFNVCAVLAVVSIVIYLLTGAYANLSSAKAMRNFRPDPKPEGDKTPKLEARKPGNCGCQDSKPSDPEPKKPSGKAIPLKPKAEGKEAGHE